jgi:Gly-Xaa carboxypeptidase
MPESLRHAILNSPTSKEVFNYMNSSLETRALIRTSTAVDVIRGGKKSNALPETAYALVNHRIAIEESVRILKDHYIRILYPLANKWNYLLDAFGTQLGSKNSPSGTITLLGLGELEPSPVSSHEDVRFSWFTETVHSVFGKEVHVAPILETGKSCLLVFDLHDGLPG